MKKVGPATIVDRVAQSLRDGVLSISDGSYLGSEDALLEQLGVSGPTLRQAARLLEAEQLLEVRRGIGGGYYARRPTMDVVTRISAVLLRTKDIGVDETIPVVGELLEPLVRLAVNCEDIVLRRELETFLTRMAGQPDEQIETDLTDLVARMSGNTALRMALTIFLSYGSISHGFIKVRRPDTEWLIVYDAMRVEFVEALLRRDEEKAIELALARFSMLRQVLLAPPG